MEPFRIEIPDDELDDLRERLGAPAGRSARRSTTGRRASRSRTCRSCARYWADGYDWRATEARLNALPQFRTEIDGLGIHFLHVRSPHADALPLVITHGWPGSIVEFLKVIGPLTDPTAHGGDARRRVPRRVPVAARLRLQRQAGRAGLGRRADRRRVGAADGRGSATSGTARRAATGARASRTSIGQQDPDHVAGIHLDAAAGRARPGHVRRPHRRRAGGAARRSSTATSGTPATRRSRRPGRRRSATALVDSPAGLCAWIVEKFWSWTDCDGHPENVLTRDELLDNLMLYWLPGHRRVVRAAVLGELREVRELFTRADTDVVAVPTGCSIFPKEIQRPRGAGRRGASPTSATGTSPTAAATSPRSSSPSCSSTRSARSSASCGSSATRRRRAACRRPWSRRAGGATAPRPSAASPDRRRGRSTRRRPRR